MKEKVYVTVPNGDGWIHKHVHVSVCRILSDSRYVIRHDCPTHTPYVQNLHKCMWDFLDHPDHFWLSIDADNPPTRNPLDLIDLDLDLVGFPTPVYNDSKPGDRPWCFNAVDWDVEEQAFREHQPAEGLQEVDAIGSGCFLVSRRVMESLKWDSPFSRIWGRDGCVEMGGDFSFCQKVKKVGFRVWAHYDYLCNHFVEVPLLHTIQAFNRID